MFFRLHKTQISTTASLKSSAFVLSCCGCRCALVLVTLRGTVRYLPAQQYNIPDQVYFFFFMYTIHNIPGSQYLGYDDPGNFQLVLYSFVLTGSRVDEATPKT